MLRLVYNESESDAEKEKKDMKRSEINALLQDAAVFFKNMNYHLPPFAFWSVEDWQNKGAEYQEIRDNQLGWDITDFGSGDFEKVGLLLFTVRNGNQSDARYDKPYAEKAMIVRVGQVTPYHFHNKKMEDIINRGGGDLIVKVYNSNEKEELADTDVTVYSDGRTYQVPAGTEIRLTPGESITLKRGCYHSFWADKATTFVGEVSQVNDDSSDNRFLEETGRFPEVEEDEKPVYLMGMDYEKYWKK